MKKATISGIVVVLSIVGFLSFVKNHRYNWLMLKQHGTTAPVQSARWQIPEQERAFGRMY